MLMVLSGLGVIFSIVLNVYDSTNKNVLNTIMEVEDDVFTTSSSE
jgi:hypothetical protein